MIEQTCEEIIDAIRRSEHPRISLQTIADRLDYLLETAQDDGVEMLPESLADFESYLPLVQHSPRLVLSPNGELVAYIEDENAVNFSITFSGQGRMSFFLTDGFVDTYED